MPKRGKANWADLLERGLTELGGEAHLKDIYLKIFSYPEAREKIELAKSKDGKSVDMKSEIRALIQRDARFSKGGNRGIWRLSSSTGTALGSEEPKLTIKSKFSLPARFKERSLRIVRLLVTSPKTNGWAQREISKELKIDINAVNKLVNFMIMEDMLYLKGGTGKTYDPYRYSPVDGILDFITLNERDQ